VGTLAYLHPLWQIGALVIGFWTLVLGLRLRARRRRRAWPRDPPLVARHARLGLVFVGLITLGYAAGPLTLGLLRGEPVFASGHALFASVTLLLFLAGGGLGLRLRRGNGAPHERDLHAYCMGLGLFLALVTVMLGLELLP
jgi:Protein of unknown function (DUF4079)